MRRRLVMATTMILVVQMIIASIGLLNLGAGDGMQGMAHGVPMVMEHLITSAQRHAAAQRAADARRGAQIRGGSALSNVASLAQTAVAPAAANAQTASDLKTPDYFGTTPNYANSPLPPNIVITSADGNGSGAEAIATIQSVVGSGGVITAGVVTAIKVTNPGSGYTSAPIITIDPTISSLSTPEAPILGDGTGASATAAVTNGQVTKITVTSGGQSYGGIRKFVDSLPGLTAAGANNFGQYIQLGVPDTTTYPGSEYYEIGLVEYSQQFHSDLPASKLRGYVQLNDPATTYQVTRDTSGKITGWPQPHYLGPTIIAHRDVPVRIKFVNLLPTGSGGDLFIPTDTTVMGAGDGPITDPATGKPEQYTQNRATLHLHGGLTPWISDGTPHQWTTPAGENTSYPKGVSTQNVPDMPAAGPGEMTFFYSNQQSARLMFYHDHAYGVTRLNVYAGEAAGYLLTDKYESTLVGGGTVPGPNGTTVNVPAETVPSTQIPLIIQDKTFVPGPNQLKAQDPTWPYIWRNGNVAPAMGNLWMPHVYMPNQNPVDQNGTNAMGRWDYSQWFWPPTAPAHGTISNPFYVPGTAEGPEIPGINNPSLTPESFMDTPIVNGVAYPYVKIKQQVYRFRILNASNDRSLNLQLYYAKSNGDMWDAQGNLNDPNAGEVDMVPAIGKPLPMGVVPPWPNDNRMGGVPNQSSVGPSWIQIGTEGGFLPAPVVLNNRPVGYENNLRNIVVTNINTHTLMLAPAERADVIVDFSKVPAGSKLILYNDSPAPVPAFDPRYDYYTGDQDQTDSGGAPTTLAGYGPNTRTIMQFQVSPASTPVPATYTPYEKDSARMTNLKTALQATFAASQDPIIVPEPDYNGVYGKSFTAVTSRIQNTSLTFTPNGASAPITVGMKPKAIQELFELEYGRMNATMGVEIPNTTGVNQTTIPLGYIDPSTESIDDSITAAAPLGTPQGTLADGTQIWKVTHNGVDTHAIHFHLFNVQIINRVGWDGQVRLPEANEIGWKDTVRMNPLEDAIVALRPIAARSPFGTYQSVRPLDVTAPLGSRMGFWPQDQFGNPVQTANKLFNFGDEYVWHCHLLGHEENDMMRPIVFNTSRIAPPAPGSVTLTNLASGVVKLDWPDATPPTPGYETSGNSWGDPKGEIGYIILRQDPGTADFAEIGRTQANATTFTDSTVVSGDYSYKVVAFNDAGGSGVDVGSNIALSPSDPVTVTVAATAVAPDAPTGLAASFLTPPMGVNLTWTAATGHVDTYTIERSADGTSGWVALGTPVTTGTSFTDSSVVANTTYYYHVIAKNAAGSTTSDTLSVLTLPDAPTNLRNSLTSATAVTLTWAAPAGLISGYTIERSSNQISWQTVGSASGATYTDNTVTSNASYFYRVSASNATGASAATPWIYVAVQPGALPIDVGTASISYQAVPSQVTLSWNASTGATGYAIQRSDSGTTWTTLGTVNNGSSLTFTDKASVDAAVGIAALRANTPYYYRVVASNAWGNSVDPAVQQVLTLPDAPIAPVTAKAAALGTIGVDLSWNPPSGVGTISAYRIDRRDGAAGAWTTIKVIDTTSTTYIGTTYTDNTTQPNTSYDYQIAATNSSGDGQASPPVTALTRPDASTITNGAPSAAGVILTWTSTNGNGLSYLVERSTDNVTWAAPTSSTQGVTSATNYTDLDALNTNSAYYYRVTAKNASGTGAPSISVTILTLPGTTSAPVATVSANGINVVWSAPSGNGTITGYLVQWSTDGGIRWSGASGLLTTSPSFLHTGVSLAGNTNYTYRVIAYNNNPATNIASVGPASAPSATVLSYPAAPGVSVSFQAGAGTNQAQAILSLAPGGNNPAAVTYTITRRTGNNGAFAPAPLTQIDANTFLDTTNLAAGTSVSYQITAKNASCTGPVAPITVRVLPRPTLTRGGAVTQAVLNWGFTGTGTSAATSFQVQRTTANTTAGWANATTFNIAGTPLPLTYTDASAVPGTTYYYRVIALSAAGSSAPSTVLTVPVSLPTPVLTGTPQAVLNWTFVGTGTSAATSFQVQRNTVNTTAGWANTANITTFNITGTPLPLTYTDASAVPGTTYYYRVIAVTALGNSPVSNVATVSVAPPAVPTALSGTPSAATATTTSLIKLSWTSTSINTTGFIVERSTNNGGTWTPIVGSPVLATAGTTSYTFVDAGLTTRTQYRYRVHAYYITPAGVTVSSANVTTGQIGAL